MVTPRIKLDIALSPIPVIGLSMTPPTTFRPGLNVIP